MTNFSRIILTTNRTICFGELTTNLIFFYSGKAFAGVFRFPIRGCFGSAENSSARAFSFGNIMSKRKNLNKKCSIEGCVSSRRITAGYCSLHYTRIMRHGNANTFRPNQSTAAENFWSKVNLTADENRCWEWQGGLSDRGYGHFTVTANNKSRNWRAHRYAWFLIYGVEPKLFLLHSCDNRKCVNPNHLREGTHKENMQDMVNRNRQSKGVDCHSAKLTPDDVLKIRNRVSKGESQNAVARDLKITQYLVWAIVHKTLWRHV